MAKKWAILRDEFLRRLTPERRAEYEAILAEMMSAEAHRQRNRPQIIAPEDGAPTPPNT